MSDGDDVNQDEETPLLLPPPPEVEGPANAAGERHDEEASSMRFSKLRGLAIVLSLGSLIFLQGMQDLSAHLLAPKLDRK